LLKVQHLARKAAAFNLKVQYYNRHQLSPSEESALNVTYCPTMSDLLSTSDVLSINCPLTPSTHHLISRPEFAQMKQGVFIVNTARGPIIDESALISALESGKVARAGLDVFETEPKIHPYFVASEKCILQPHLGGVTTRARKDAEIECFENVKAYFRTGRPVAPVNEIERDK
jgi:lactate dehydrogenase-like 2-hydroxyacid dehydrogenase